MILSCRVVSGEAAVWRPPPNVDVSPFLERQQPCLKKQSYLMCLPRPILPQSPALDAAPRVGAASLELGFPLRRNPHSCSEGDLLGWLGSCRFAVESCVCYCWWYVSPSSSPTEEKENVPLTPPLKFLVLSHLWLKVFNQSLRASPFPLARWGHQYSFPGTSRSSGSKAPPQYYLLVFFVPFLTWSREAGGLLLA